VVLNTLVADNGGNGIVVQPQPSAGTLWAAVSESVASNNGLSGFAVQFVATIGAVNFTLVRSVAARNGTGISTSGTIPELPTATVAVGQSTVTQNGISWSGNVLSFADNYIFANGDGDPAPVAIPKK